MTSERRQQVRALDPPPKLEHPVEGEDLELQPPRALSCDLHSEGFIDIAVHAG